MQTSGWCFNANFYSSYQLVGGQKGSQRKGGDHNQFVLSTSDTDGEEIDDEEEAYNNSSSSDGSNSEENNCPERRRRRTMKVKGSNRTADIACMETDSYEVSDESIFLLTMLKTVKDK